MASYTLYRPIVDSYMPAFEAGTNSYSKLYLSTNKSGKIEVEIEKLYTKEEINYINNGI